MEGLAMILAVGLEMGKDGLRVVEGLLVWERWVDLIEERAIANSFSRCWAFCFSISFISF